MCKAGGPEVESRVALVPGCSGSCVHKIKVGLELGMDGERTALGAAQGRRCECTGQHVCVLQERGLWRAVWFSRDCLEVRVVAF